ncbi:MAG TPA: sigma-70 family RNA polymerase sigma factor [Rhizomicrobium sp.]
MPIEESSPLITAYLSHRDGIERLLTARLGNRDDAQEVTQELYIRLGGIDATDVRDSVGYVFKVALNLASDRRRQRQRALLRDADWADVRQARGGGDAIDDEPSAERAYAARQQLGAVRAVLAELSPQCRQAFLLHKFEGLSHQEVAERAGITRSTVEKHMATALKHLMRRLGGD